MAKGFLVLDVPDSCRECKLFVQGPIYYCSGVEFTSPEEHIKQAGWLGDHYAGSRPDWCPLRPLPQKDNDDYYPDEFQDGIKTGWNVCIDAILKGGEIDE